MGNPVNWFEIPVTDIERAKIFFEKVFGFELSINQVGDTLMAWFPMEEGGVGATGALVKGVNTLPSNNGCMIYFSVEDIDGILDRVNTHGGKIVNSKTSIGQFGFFGDFIDTEGNKIGLHSLQ